jgi:hypothetical protein
VPRSHTPWRRFGPATSLFNTDPCGISVGRTVEGAFCDSGESSETTSAASLVPRVRVVSHYWMPILILAMIVGNVLVEGVTGK